MMKVPKVLYIVTLTALLLCFWSCRENLKAIRMDEIYRLVGDNECFYKGGYGIVTNDVYIKKGDSNNNLYTASKTLFNGGKRGVDELIYIKNPAEPVPMRIPLESINQQKTGILLLFRKDYVYILDYSSNQYCKYRR